MITRLVFNLVDGVTRTLRGIGAGLSGLNQQFANLNQTTELLGKGLSALGSGFGLLPALQKTGEFEDALAAVQAVTGATADEMDRLKAAAEAATDFSSTEAANGLAELARAGFSATDAISGLNPALDLAKGQQLSVADSATILTTTLTQFGLAASDAGRVADVLASAADKTSTDVRGLGLSLSYAAPLAKQLGLTLEQTVSVLGALGNEGFRGERAGTALLNVFSALNDPASKFSKAIREAGIQSTDFATIIGELAKGGAGAERALLQLDTSARPAITALVSKGSAGMLELQKAFEAASGSAKATANILGDTFNSSLSRLGNAFQNAKNSFLEPLLPKLTIELDAVAKQITAFIKTADFTALSQNFTNFVLNGVKAFKEFAASIDFAKLLTNIQNFVTSAGQSLAKIAEAAGVLGTALSKAIEGASTFASGIRSAFNVASASAQKSASIVLDGLNAITGGTENTIAAARALDEAYSESLSQARDSFGEFGEGAARIIGIHEDLTAQADSTAAAQIRAAKAITDTGAAATDAAPKVGALSTELGLSAAQIKENAAVIANAAVGVTESLAKLGGFDLSAAVAKVQALIAEVSKVPLTAEQAANGARAAFAQLAGDAQSSGDAIYTAFRKALEAAGDDRSLRALRTALEGIATDGRLSAEQVGSAFAALENKIRSTGGAVTDALTSAFADLNIKSSAELKSAADNAARNFAIIESAARSGAATVGDVRAAFDAYAAAQRAAVATAPEFERSQVEAMLAAKAAALGLADALDSAGESGSRAAGTIASSAGAATSALNSAAAASRDVAAATAEAGTAAGLTVSEEEKLNNAYRQRSLVIGEVSSNYQRLIEEIFQTQGGGGRLFGAYERAFTQLNAELNEQNRLAQEHLRNLRDQAALYDPLAQQIRELENRYGHLGETILRQIATEELRIKGLRKTAEEAKKAAQETIETTSSFGAGSGTGPRAGFGPNGPSGGNPNGPSGGNPQGNAGRQAETQRERVNVSVLVVDDMGADQLARKLMPFLNRLSANRL